MSHDSVELASLRASLDQSQRQVRRVLHVLRAVGHEDRDSWCFCGAYLSVVGGHGPHSDRCLAARRELLALSGCPGRPHPEAPGQCEEPGRCGEPRGFYA